MVVDGFSPCPSATHQRLFQYIPSPILLIPLSTIRALISYNDWVPAPFAGRYGFILGHLLFGLRLGHVDESQMCCSSDGGLSVSLRVDEASKLLYLSVLYVMFLVSFHTLAVFGNGQSESGRKFSDSRKGELRRSAIPISTAFFVEGLSCHQPPL
jgi:hypothetical protein